MTFLTLFYIAAAASLSCLCAAANGNYPTDPVEKFNRLCLDEYTTKAEYDREFDLVSSGKLYKKYEELTDARRVLGAKLGIHFCPDNLIGHLNSGKDIQLKQKDNRKFDEKCHMKAKSAVLCKMSIDALKVNKGPEAEDYLSVKKMKYCVEYNEAKKALEEYKFMNVINDKCDVTVVVGAEREAQIEAAESLKLPETKLESDKQQKSSSFGCKIGKFLSGCFNPSKKMVHQ